MDSTLLVYDTIDEAMEHVSLFDELAELTTSVESLLQTGDRLDEIYVNIQRTHALLQKQPLTRAMLTLLNEDGGLDEITEGQVTKLIEEAVPVEDPPKELEKEIAKTLTEVSTEALEQQSEGLFAKIKRWFKELWAWFGRIVRRIMDFFISNEKILARLEANVRGGTLRVEKDSKVSGVKLEVLTQDSADLRMNLIEKINQKEFSEADVNLMTDKLKELVGKSTSATVSELGWDNKEAVASFINQCSALNAKLKEKGTDVKAVKDAEREAEKGMQGEGDKEKVKEARKAAANHVKLILLRVKLSKFLIGQAMKMGRLYTPAKKTA